MTWTDLSDHLYTSTSDTNERVFNPRRSKGKRKGLDTCYSAAYVSQTRDQQRFTISEVAADWHKPMVRAHGQLDPRCS